MCGLQNMQLVIQLLFISTNHLESDLHKLMRRVIQQILFYSPINLWVFTSEEAHVVLFLSSADEASRHLHVDARQTEQQTKLNKI